MPHAANDVSTTSKTFDYIFSLFCFVCFSIFINSSAAPIIIDILALVCDYACILHSIAQHSISSSISHKYRSVNEDAKNHFVYAVSMSSEIGWFSSDVIHQSRWQCDSCDASSIMLLLLLLLLRHSKCNAAAAALRKC